MALNASVNITCFGSFEADNTAKALELIKENVRLQYCQRWQFPQIEMYIDCMRNEKQYLRHGLFVCEGEPFLQNVIWKDSKAVINFHVKKT